MKAGGMLALSALLALAPAEPAHELRPGYLELRELGGDRYVFDCSGRCRARGDERFGFGPVLPDALRTRSRRPVHDHRRRLRRALSASHAPAGSTAARFASTASARRSPTCWSASSARDGTAQVAPLLTPAAPSFVVEAAPGSLDVARTYLALGVEHILFGFDHLLFVLALLILVGATAGSSPP